VNTKEQKALMGNYIGALRCFALMT